MIRILERLLHLHRGDLRRGGLLFLYLFLIIGGYVVAKAARDALFLDRFAAIKLPYADIAIALLVGFAVAAYVRAGRRMPLGGLQFWTLLVLTANVFGFWGLARFTDWPWTFPLFYIWVGIYGVLAPAQVWTLANYVLTTREAKRLFGLVGSGAIAGWIFGGAFTRLFAERFGTESLMLGVGMALAACAGLVTAIWRGSPLARAREGASDLGIQSRASVARAIALIGGSRYLQAIAAVICLSSFVTTIAGWQFKAFAAHFLGTKDAIAAFFGTFNFYAGILGLLVQLFLTSRVLKRFGIGPALFVVPTALFFGSVTVLLSFSLAAAVFLKGSDQILRYSIDRSTVELLYLPVPGGIKVQVKSFIDTVIWRLGDGFAGVMLLLAAAPLGLAARPDRVSWLNLLFIGMWLAAALVGRRQYVTTLRDSLHKHRLDAERAGVPVLDRSTADVLATKLTADDPGEILYALDLFQMGRDSAHPAVRGLLRHADAGVRRRAVSILASARDRAAASEVEALLHDDDPGVRTEAILYVAHHAHVDPLSRIREIGDFPGFSIRAAMASFLAQPGPAQNLDTAGMMLRAMAAEPGEDGSQERAEVARLLGHLPDEFEGLLESLLRDEHPAVARAAIGAAGSLGKRRFVDLLFERLGDAETREAAAEALAAFGDRILGACRDHLSDPEVPLPVRRRIPGVLARVGDPIAGRILSLALLAPDTELRYRTLSALNKLRRANADLEVDREMVETVLGAEILGHYRSYQILGALKRDLDADPAVLGTLRDAMQQEVERIFRLLALLLPRIDLHSAYFGLQSKDPAVHDNSLEFLDNVLRPQVRGLLVPLLDSAVPLEERVRLADRFVGIRMESRESAVAQLISSPDPWLRSCGAFAIGALRLRSLAARLDRCLNDPDPLLRETARQAKARLEEAPGT